MNGTILIYGATGYTGKLITKVAVDQGAGTILAGRDLEKVKALAGPLGLAARAFDLRRLRRKGRIVSRDDAEAGSCNLGKGKRPTIQVSWGDVATAFRSTGIPNIEVHI